MHYCGKLSSDFCKIFQRLCRRQQHLKITPSRKPRCPSPSIRGTFLLFPFSTLLSRRLPCSAAYFRTSSIIFMLQKCGPHMEQKCAVFACGNVSSWNSRAVSGLAAALAGCSCKTSGFCFSTRSRLIASNEDQQLPFRAEAAQCLQSRGRVCGGSVAHDPGGIDFPSCVQCAAMGDEDSCCCHHPWPLGR